MPVLSFPFGMLEANAYLVHNGTDAVAADPPDDPNLILNAVREAGVTLRAILVTHLHFDHVTGCAALAEATGLPIFIGRQDWEMRDLFLSKGMLFGMPPVRPFDAVPLEPGPVTWGSLACEVIHAPGHSPGSLCYYFPQEQALLAGDVLFYRSVGRCDLPGGNGDTLLRTLRTVIYTLPPETVVYPGHSEPTTVGDEAAHNPFCRAEHV